jgi:hypothetical protein
MNKKILLSLLFVFFTFTGNVFLAEYIDKENVLQEEYNECDEFDEFKLDFDEIDECDISEEKSGVSSGMTLIEQVMFIIKHPLIAWYIMKLKAGEYQDAITLHLNNNGKYYLLVIGVVGGVLITYYTLNKYGNQLRFLCPISVDYLL